MNKKWTEEMCEFLKANVEGLLNEDLTRMVNDRFGTDFTLNAISKKKFDLGLKSGIQTAAMNGVNSRFQKGHVPANKGKTMSPEVYEKVKPTSFKKGHRPHNQKEVGDEKVGKDGYIFIKVSDEGHVWRPKQVVLWEQYNNDTVGKSELVVFLNGDKYDFRKENLYKLTRGELVTLNHWFEKSSDPEVTLNHILQVKIMKKRKKLAEANGLVDKRGVVIPDSRERQSRYSKAIKEDPEKYQHYLEYHRKWSKAYRERKKGNESKS